MFLKLQILTVISMIFISGCKQSEPAPKVIQLASSEKVKPVQEETMKDNAKYQYKGTIHFMNLEGGFYGIITDKGEKFLPLGLDKKYFKQGTVISFSGKHEKGLMTIQQWGTPFRINEVQLISPGKNISNPDI